MLSRIFALFAILVSVAAFAPPSFGRVNNKVQLSMNVQNQLSKFVGVAIMGFTLAGPALPVLADGAVSDGTVFRVRNSYGRRIVELGEAASKGNFDAFAAKKSINSFDLFISGSNAKKNDATKARKAAEKELEAKIYAAVQAKDAGKLKSAYDEFIKVADLKSDFKSGEKGQTDSSGYSPTWGTPGQFIYQR